MSEDKNNTPIKRGKKEKYDDYVKPFLNEISYWISLGETEEDICRNRLNIGVSNFAVYKNKYKELKDAIKKGRTRSCSNVAGALYKRAMGYEYPEKIYEYFDLKDIYNEPIIDKKTGKTKQYKKLIKIVDKEVVPDTTAQIFFLINRDPENWRNKRDVEHSGEVGTSKVRIVELPDNGRKITSQEG